MDWSKSSAGFLNPGLSHSYGPPGRADFFLMSTSGVDFLLVLPEISKITAGELKEKAEGKRFRREYGRS